jgi:hypothetical protein
MTTWKKLINSGSNAHVASLNISDTPSDVPTSLKSDGTVLFTSLPTLQALPVGRLMKSVTPAVNGGTSRYVMISNDFTPITGLDFQIPPNQTAADLNQDGVITAGDLLLFLGAYGSTGANLPADLDNNGAVTTGDLLAFLSAFGTNMWNSYGTYGVGLDTRPFIDWGLAQYNYIEVVNDGDNITHSWVNDDLYVTVESVTDLYDKIVEVEGNDNYFWNTLLPSSVSTYLISMDALISPLEAVHFAVFIYIYFSQISGTGYILVEGEQTPIGGGHSVYNRTGILWSGTGFASAPSYPYSPVGYGPYPS